MKYLAPRAATVLASCFFLLPAAFAQSTVSVSGTVTDMNGIAMGHTVQVRAWSYVEDEATAGGETYTGYLVKSGHSTFVDGNGAYTLNLPPGEYRLDARVGIGGARYPAYSPANARYWLEEKWHEAGSAADQNFVLEDATVLNVVAGNPITELNFRLGLGGAVEGRVQGYTASSPSSRVWLTGARVRVEQVSDVRRHHNAVTRGNPQGNTGVFNGRFVNRGLRPALGHRLIVYDREGRNRTYVHGTNHTPSAGQIHSFGTISLAAMDTDPYPTNRSIGSAVRIGRANFDLTPPQPWSTGTSPLARIAPRNTGVVNWFCWTVLPEDRFIITATTMDTIPELPGRYHPWIDPHLKVVNEDDPDVTIPGTEPDRYSGPGPLDARVDTGRIGESATYCAAVTMAGDTSFDGQGQWTSGPYVLEIEMGNRAPRVDVVHEGVTNPSHIAIGEGDSIEVIAQYTDPDGDPMTASAHFRRGATPIGGWSFTPGATSGTWTWTAPADGAGAYTLTFTVSDHEFSTSRSVPINVGTVNFPPTTPVLLSPPHGGTVTTRTPTLVFENSEDPDGPDSELRYEVEIYYQDPAGGAGADQIIDDLPHGTTGVVSTVPSTLPEKRNIWWRARADDGEAENRYSDWTDFRRFFVHALPPEIDAYLEDEPAPSTIGINEGETLVLDLEYRAPYGPIPGLAFRLSDRDGTEVAPEPELEILDSGQAGEGAATFTWSIGPLDSEGSPYDLLFTASDNLYSTDLPLVIDVLSFNLPPTAPAILEPLDQGSVDSRFPVIVAENAVDPEGDEVFLHFEISDEDDFDTLIAASPVEGVPQDEASGETSWEVDVALEWGEIYFVRARAADEHGLFGPYSPAHAFEVNPRTAPVIVQPEMGATVSSRQPTIVARNASDPDGVPLFLHFEVASDGAFTSLVAQTEAPGVPQDESGETSWEVATPLTFGETYYVRAVGVDEEGVFGPTSAPVTFDVRENSPPTPSTLGGPFEARCSGGVITENPLVVPVIHGTDPDGDPVYVQLQVYPYGAEPDEDILVDTMVPAETEGDITEITIDLGSLPDNSRYTIRVRSYDGIDYSSWHTCDFWSNIRNNPPSELVILSPDPGTVLPLDTKEVMVIVQNASDPDSIVPGTSLDIAWCSSLSEDFEDCPEDVSEWESVPQSSLDPADTTEFMVTGLTNREAWHIKACARDELGLCGTPDTTWVLVGDDGAEVPVGCCTTSPNGDPWLAMLAVLCLALLAPRRRGRVE